MLPQPCWWILRPIWHKKVNCNLLYVYHFESKFVLISLGVSARILRRLVWQVWVHRALSSESQFTCNLRWWIFSVGGFPSTCIVFLCKVMRYCIPCSRLNWVFVSYRFLGRELFLTNFLTIFQHTHSNATLKCNATLMGLHFQILSIPNYSKWLMQL